MSIFTDKELSILLISIEYQYAELKKPVNSCREIELLNSLSIITSKLTTQKQHTTGVY